MAKKLFSSSGNPFMKENAYRNSSQEILDSGFTTAAGERMTVQGAVNKSFILFGLMLLTTVVSFAMPSPLFLWTGIIGGLIAVLVGSFKPHLSPTVAPIYALLEGLFVGSVSAMYGGAFGNAIIFQAVTLTMGLLFAMLFIYKTGIIKVTDKLRMGVAMATLAVLMVYLLNIVLGFFGINLPYLHQGGAIGIGISVVIIGIASFNLLLDFDNFEKGEQFGAPAYMEWFSAMGLLVTLVWLYVEILRLLSLLSGRD
ncbi:MAG: Bax inhibitor-1/YccA family protein [Bacteroidetes bacterium]|nr:Bax inhibitor-1/YccA family protein [Bacteroidota bacterium]